MGKNKNKPQDRTAEMLTNVVEHYSKPQAQPAPAQAPQSQPEQATTGQEAPKRTRVGVQPPRASQFTFDPGEQVALVNLEHPGDKRWRTHYEYVKRDGLFDYVKRTTDGAVVRVWLNKLMPMREAMQLKKRVLSEEQAPAQAPAQAKSA